MRSKRRCLSLGFKVVEVVYVWNGLRFVHKSDTRVRVKKPLFEATVYTTNLTSPVDIHRNCSLIGTRSALRASGRLVLVSHRLGASAARSPTEKDAPDGHGWDVAGNRGCEADLCTGAFIYREGPLDASRHCVFCPMRGWASCFQRNRCG